MKNHIKESNSKSFYIHNTNILAIILFIVSLIGGIFINLNFSENYQYIKTIILITTITTFLSSISLFIISFLYKKYKLIYIKMFSEIFLIFNIMLICSFLPKTYEEALLPVFLSLLFLGMCLYSIILSSLIRTNIKNS